MNATLEERLRRHYDDQVRELPRHGPGLDAGTILPRYESSDGPASGRKARLPLVVGSIAAVVVLGLVVANRPSEQPDGGASGDAGTGDLQELAPVVTLPAGNDVFDTPVTVDATSPTDWYRLQPDLDVAWYQAPDGQSPSMLCWRTPVSSDCVVDDAPGALPLIVPTAGDQTLVVWLGNGESTLGAQLASGGVLSVPLAIDDQIGWGVARFAVSQGDSISSVGRASAAAGEPVVVTGQTLPPTVGLADSPVTIPPGSELSYWRWFPDLDISERATEEGGTELCWRTPAGTGCIDDSFMSPDVGVIPTDGGAILLARPALVPISPPPTDPLEPKFEMGPDPTSVTVRLSDGSTVTADVDYGEQFGVGYARIDVPDGVTVTEARSS